MKQPPVHIQPHEWEQVAAILEEHLPGRAVWAFGSRATGARLKPFSDLDLAVSGTMTWNELATLADAFNESLLPFKVDIVELGALDPEFQKRIEGDFVPVAEVPSSPISPVPNATI